MKKENNKLKEHLKSYTTKELEESLKEFKIITKELEKEYEKREDGNKKN